MGILEVIFYTIITLIAAFTILTVTVAICETTKIKHENEKLKKDLEKARKKIIKNEYKKISKVGGNK